MAAKENRMGILCHLLLVFLAKVCHFVKIFFKFSKVSPCWDTIFSFGTMFQGSTIGTFFKNIVIGNVLQ